MMKFGFELIILALAAVLFLLFGKNKQEEKNIPKGMQCIAIPAIRRYFIYAVGIFMFVFVMGFSALAIMDGAWDEAGSYIILCILLSIVILILFFILGYQMYASHTFFDEEKLLIGRPFRGLHKIYWYEIGNIRLKSEGHIILYDHDGRKVFEAYANMDNYHAFYKTATQQCNPYLKENNMISGQSGTIILRMGKECYILAVLFIFMFGMDLFICRGEFLTMLKSKELGLFPKVFPLVSGFVGVWLLLFASRRKIVCGYDTLDFYFFIRKRASLRWNEIEKIKFAEKHRKLPKITVWSGGKNYAIPTGYMNDGFDAFRTEFLDKIKDYHIPVDT